MQRRACNFIVFVPVIVVRSPARYFIVFVAVAVVRSGARNFIVFVAVAVVRSRARYLILFLAVFWLSPLCAAVHATAFIGFMFSSLLYMLLNIILLGWWQFSSHLTPNVRDLLFSPVRIMIIKPFIYNL